jgi:hypothetical protein
MYKEGISMNVFPPLFRDAIEMTRALDIRLLWIGKLEDDLLFYMLILLPDSLCIRQDSDSDWETESAKMGAIYASSFLTLAATSALDSTGQLCLGPPVERELGILGMCSDESLNTASGEKQCEDLVMLLNEEVGIQSRRARDMIIGGPLNARGWVFQEALLSGRIVHYTKSQVYWECLECFQSEDGLCTDGWPPSSTDARLRTNSPRVKYEDWQRLVEEYTLCHFTFEHDRFAAMAGSIQGFLVNRFETPVLGLRLSNIAFDLCWANGVKERFGGRSQTLPSSRALRRINGLAHFPTWSWIAVGNRISYVWRVENMSECKRLMAVESWSVNWSGMPYTSRLVSAGLKVT